MTNETDKDGILLPPKDRVTKWVRFVRKTSLDELLNFWSIFKGDMSIIGPRPLVMTYLPRYSERHKMRHAVNPGLECPPVSGIPLQGSIWQRQFENDVWYVENISFLTDLKCFFALISLVFNKKDSEIRANALRGSFMGYDEEGFAIDNNQISKKYLDRLYKELS